MYNKLTVKDILESKGKHKLAEVYINQAKFDAAYYLLTKHENSIYKNEDTILRIAELLKQNKQYKNAEDVILSFLERKKEVKDLFDEKFVKMWEFYMASCAAAFRYRDLVVFQLQIVKNFQSAHRTRDYIYS